MAANKGKDHWRRHQEAGKALVPDYMVTWRVKSQKPHPTNPILPAIEFMEDQAQLEPPECGPESGHWPQRSNRYAHAHPSLRDDVSPLPVPTLRIHFGKGQGAIISSWFVTKVYSRGKHDPPGHGGGANAYAMNWTSEYEQPDYAPANFPDRKLPLSGQMSLKFVMPASRESQDKTVAEGDLVTFKVEAWVTTGNLSDSPFSDDWAGVDLWIGTSGTPRLKAVRDPDPANEDADELTVHLSVYKGTVQEIDVSI